MDVMVASRTGFHFVHRESAGVATITLPGPLLTNCADAGTRRCLKQLARSISSWRYTDRDATPVALVTVVGADVDPLQSVWRPHPAPAAIVGGVGERRANERKAIEAVMDEAAPVMEREA